MKKPFDQDKDWADQRAKIIGLGERSARKNYYPQLKQRISELERFQGLVEVAHNLFITVREEDLRILDANKVACQVFDLSSEQAERGALKDYPVFAAIVQAIESSQGKTIQFEARVTSSHLGDLDLLLDFHCVEIDHVRYGILEGRNISERKAAERSLREAHQTLEERVRLRTADLEREIEERRQIEMALRKSEEKLIAAKHQAEEASQAKSDFLSSMSHELRTPLNAILGFAQLFEFQADTALTTKQRDYIQQILKSGKHLLELINEVLDLAKIESGKIQLSFEPVCASQMVDDTLELIAPLLDKYNVFMERPHNIMNRRQFVWADAMRLRQVLINLLSNAVKYNKPNGRVTLSVKTLEKFLCFEVSDTGRGISEDGLKELFTPFNRLNEEGTSIEGTGIGLTITAKLVELMGGHIEVQSKVGEGSTFSVFIPKATGGQAPEALEKGLSVVPEHQVDAGKNRPARILYVEDNPANLMVLQELVQQIPDVDFHSAKTGEKGLEIIMEKDFDLILLDINLPGMGGFEILENIGERKNCPIIALSASAMNHDLEKAKAGGFDDYLTKPLDLRKAINLITSTLFDKDK